LTFKRNKCGSKFEELERPEIYKRVHDRKSKFSEYGSNKASDKEENDTFYEEDEDDTSNKNRTPIMTPERATYIMLVCTGRILIEDLSVSGYCSGIQFCLSYKSMGECYTDLKNGEIENFSTFS
jgi:hypothetical protein